MVPLRSGADTDQALFVPQAVLAVVHLKARALQHMRSTYDGDHPGRGRYNQVLAKVSSSISSLIADMDKCWLQHTFNPCNLAAFADGDPRASGVPQMARTAKACAVARVLARFQCLGKQTVLRGRRPRPLPVAASQ